MRIGFVKYMGFWPAIIIRVKKWNRLYYFLNFGTNHLSHFLLRVIGKPLDLFCIYDEEFLKEYPLPNFREVLNV